MSMRDEEIADVNVEGKIFRERWHILPPACSERKD
jgi:hypothetical protein